MVWTRPLKATLCFWSPTRLWAEAGAAVCRSGRGVADPGPSGLRAAGTRLAGFCGTVTGRLAAVAGLYLLAGFGLCSPPGP